ncbi:MAG: protoporphyrinogen oxidase [Bacteroidota bacterium]|nr:protoporphyrinogen oxidase [Bacteroidota bacterium]
MPRLFIYAAEANEKIEPERSFLITQLQLMQRRLWYIIAWPSAVITLIIGCWIGVLYGSLPDWLIIKIGFVIGLYIYFLLCHQLFRQQQKNIFKYSSNKLRMWNEVATIFLFAIVFLAVVKTSLSWLSGLTGLVILIILLMLGINLYKRMRKK